MRFEQPLLSGYLIRRYKRFLADVRLRDGRVVTVHCPNSGSMRTCDRPGWEVRLLPAAAPGRKTAYTWELVHNGRCWIGIDTQMANRVAGEALRAGIIPELALWSGVQREIRWAAGCRFDFRLTGENLPDCFVEVKNVTLLGDDGKYCFPDAPTERGRKHLRELMHVVEAGLGAAVLFVIQRSDGDGFRPAREIDPDYADLLHQARECGVRIFAWRAAVTPAEIRLEAPEPLCW